MNLKTTEQRQIDLEQESVMLGQVRYNADRALPWSDTTRSKDDESSSVPGRHFLKLALEPTAFLIEKFIEKAGSGKAGRKHSALPYLVKIDPLQAAYLACRGAINGAAGNLAVTTTASQIAASIEEHINLTRLAKEHPGLYRKVSEQLKTSTSARHRSAVFREVVRRYADAPLSWSQKERALLGMKLLELFIDATSMVKMVRTTVARNKTPHLLQFEDEWAETLQRAHEQCSLLCPVHLPMVHPPRPWRHPYAGGYLTDAIRTRLVQTRDRAYLDEIGSLELGPVLKAVNTIQETPWRINRRIYEVMADLWDSLADTSVLPSRRDRDLPPRPAGVDPNVSIKDLPLDLQEDMKAWKARASEVHVYNAKLVSERMQLAQKLWVARRFVDEEAIYFPHYLDFRGRVYPFASFLNPQSDDTAKGLLEFAEGKPLGEDGAYWLAVHIANLFGVDKVSFDDRVQWVFDNEQAILDSGVDPLNGEQFWMAADSPWQALAACMDWVGYKVNGDDHVSHTPVAMDGSCSGLQHFSALLRDEVGGAAVNLVPAETPADIYSTVAERAQVVSDASGSEYSSAWTGKVCRKVAKQPTMTLCYSATQYGMRGQIKSALDKLDDEQPDGRYLNGDTENHHAAAYMAGIVWDSLGDVVVAARRAMDWLQEVANLFTEAGLTIRWTTPMGLPVVQGYRTMVGERLKVFVGGERVRLTLSDQAPQLDKRKQAAGIAPNFVHSLDSAHLMRTATLGRLNGIESLCVIHDSFATHACNTSLLNAVIREAFVQQYTDDLLNKFRDEAIEQLTPLRPDLAAEVPPVPAFGSLDIAAVKNSDFFFA